MFVFRKSMVISIIVESSDRSCGLGDKLTNRHGAKGVIAQIYPDDKMPRLPDGTHVDVCLNSLGVISRMNVGQIMEMHVGNVLHAAQDWLKKNISDTTKCVDMLCELYSLLDPFSDKRLSSKMTSQFRAYPINKQKELVDYYSKNGVRIIMPPFENLKLEEVNKAAKLVNTELESRLFIPEFNRYTMQPITWGYIYMIKLQHISSIKQNVRSVGPYLQTTMMPSKPGQHRNAIRLGEQDSWAFCSYPQGKEVLREMFLVNADNPTIKNDIINSIETTGSGDIDEEKYGNMVSGASSAFKIYSTIAGLAIK